MNTPMKIDRRDFLKVSALTGSGLLLGFRLPPQAGDEVRLMTAVTADAAEQAAFEPNVYLHIDADGTVTLTVHRTEMGQGVQTALPMIIADELEADWSKVCVRQAPAETAYGDMVTGGSVSVQTTYAILRMAGATARTLLVTAAAQLWGVPVEECRAQEGAVYHDASGRQAAYGDLVETAAALPKPGRGEVVLKDPSQFRLIGTPRGQIDEPEMVTGSAVYASDIQLPGMLYAVIARCPVFGGSVASFDASDAQAVPGVRQVLQVSTGVAVVAESTWAALNGRDTLKVEWDYGSNADLNSDGIRQMALERIDRLAENGSAMAADAASVVEAYYEVPYLSHADLEPMVCVADVRQDSCEVWAPTQDRMAARGAAQSASRVGGRGITIHVPPLGGGFGRRLRVDYVGEAVELSKAVGAPVKTFWSRDEDLQHDFYRPASLHRVRAGLDAENMPLTWEHYLSAQMIGGASELEEGAIIPYRIGKKTVRSTVLSLPIPTGYWRSVFNTQNAFVSESFIDELAAAAGRDPVEFRLSLLDDRAPLKRVLQLAVERAGWGSELPAGWARGVACHTTWSTHVAQVAEVSVEEGKVRVHRVVCAIDCGKVVNPGMVEAQMEGGIVFGLTSALYGEITLQDGRVEQNSLRDYRLLPFDEMPAVEVIIVPSDAAPLGVGEMGVPPITPAVTNAIFAATGRRIRRLPIRREDLIGS